MRKLICAVVSGCLWCGGAAASAVQEADVLKIFTEVPKQYAEEIRVEDLGVLMLQGLSNIDKKIKVANDGKRVTFYYDGKVEKSYLKPENSKDAKAWTDMTIKFIDLAVEVSPAAMKKDFELFDLIMEDVVKHLDRDSKYYRSYGAMKDKKLRHKRNFADRMIGNVLYIKILAFNSLTKDKLLEVLEKNQDAKGLIIDLRGSPGGMVSEAVAVADYFLNEGIIGSAIGRSGNTFYNSQEGDIIDGKPIVVLIDKDTASAAEVLAAALQEQGRAKIVGTNSYGKGSIQNLIEVNEGSVLALTSAYIFTPSGSRLHKVGVIPEVCTSEMPDFKNIDKLLAQPRHRSCPGEARADKGLDIDVARTMLGDY